MIREIERFKARAKDGYETTIIVDEKVVEMQDTGGITQEPISKSARTIDGHMANRIDDNTFRIIGLGSETIVRRI